MEISRTFKQRFEATDLNVLSQGREGGREGVRGEEWEAGGGSTIVLFTKRVRRCTKNIKERLLLTLMKVGRPDNPGQNQKRLRNSDIFNHVKSWSETLYENVSTLWIVNKEARWHRWGNRGRLAVIPHCHSQDNVRWLSGGRAGEVCLFLAPQWVIGPVLTVSDLQGVIQLSDHLPQEWKITSFFFFFSSLLFLSQELLSSTFIWAFFFFLLLAPGTNRHLTRQMWHLVTLWWTVRPKQNISVPFTEGLTRGTVSSVAACVTNPVFNPSCSSVGHTLHCAALLWCWRDSVYLLLDLCVPTCESLMIGADLRMW